MKPLNFLVGALVVAASLVAAPAVLGSLLAAGAGVLLMLSPDVGHPPPQTATATVMTRPAPDPLRVFELDDGASVVVFRNVDGKLVSRLYRAAQA